ncbi:MAG: 23S rRNA (guanosine(2251)-2'-O)-methyltransferase RlmB [Bacteroidales bacterium]|nr:23S rRNA (guanosine(2251)-2'-O)-methyltransferase RlmB [Bacteroidales bacterium]
MKFSNEKSVEKNMIYGIHPVMEALRSGKEFDKILLQKGASSPLFKELFQEIRNQNCHFQFVPEPKLNSLTKGNHQGVVGLASLVSYVTIDEVITRSYESGKIPLVVILDKVTDVRNMGAIARTAECAGADAIVFPVQNSAPISGDAIKSSAGALLQLSLVRSENLKSTINYLKESGLQIIAASEKATNNYFNLNLNQPTAIIMGSEETGISPEYLKLATAHVTIPMSGKIESLNVSAAAAALLFETVRQRIIASRE